MRSPRLGAQASPTPSLLVSGRSDYHLGVVSTHVHPDNTKRGLLLAPWADSRHCMRWNVEFLREGAALAVISGND